MTPFEEHISSMDQIHLTYAGTANASSIKPLLHALGCVDVEHMDSASNLPAAADPRSEPMVVQILHRALRKMFDGNGWTYESISIQLLDGLSKNNRLQKCLETEDDAYALASLIFVFDIEKTVPRTSGGEGVLEQIVTPSVCAALTDWLQPAVPFSAVPSASEMARLLFGEAWCCLTLDTGYQSPTVIKNLVQTQRPPFLTGRLGCHAEPTPAVLPAFD